jgi:predicted TIM-barrel fold metal-dependent hydrolase
MGKIDALAHVFLKPSAEFPRETSEEMPEEREAPVELLLAQMEANDVDQAVLVQAGGAEVDQHSYLLKCLKDHPGQFRGIGRIPDDTDDPKEHMDRLAGEGDIIGFQLERFGGPLDPLGPMIPSEWKMYAAYEHAAEKDFVLYLYPEAAQVHMVPFFLEAFPQVRTVFKHMMVCPGRDGVTWTDGKPHIEVQKPSITRHTTAEFYQFENVYSIMSGSYAISDEAWPYEDLTGWHSPLSFVRRYGSDHSLWGSDFPFVLKDPGYAKTAELMETVLADTPKGDLENVMGEAARRILRFKELETA